MISQHFHNFFSPNLKKSDAADSLISDNPFPYLPTMVELNHLYANNKLLTDEMIDSVKEWFKSNAGKNILRYRMKDNLQTIILKLQQPQSKLEKLYAVYLGIKPKSYHFCKYTRTKQLEKWMVSLEEDKVKDQINYRVIDPISGLEITDIISSDQLPALKKMSRPYQTRDLQRLSNAILKITSERGHTYQKKILGSGGYGTVKVMQDLETGEWCALKKMRYAPPDNSHSHYNPEKDLLKEIRNLTILNLSLGVINESTSSSKYIKFVGMKLIPGMNLYDFKVKNTGLNQLEWLTFFVKLIECATKFYQAGYLHLDIKPENIIYNRHTNEMNFIDFGFLAFGKTFKARHTFGTDNYLPPEFDDRQRLDFKFLQCSTPPTAATLHLLDAKVAYVHVKNELYYINQFQQVIKPIPIEEDKLNDFNTLAAVLLNHGGRISDRNAGKLKALLGHSPSYIFNEKSIVYNLGIIIAEMLDLDKPTNKLRIVDDIEEKFIKNVCIPNLALRKEIAEYLKLMTRFFMFSRPTLMETLQFFKSKLLELPDIICHTRKIGILNVSEYIELNEQNRLLMHDRLKLMDEIWFIDRHQSYQHHYYQLRRELEKAEVNVGNHVFSIKENISDPILLHAITNHQTPDSIHAYFYITNRHYSSDKTASFDKIGMGLLLNDTKEKNRNKIRDYLSSHTLLNEQYEMLAFLLTSKKNQLLKKYGTENPVAKKRISTLECIIEYFKQAHENQILSYSIINEVLKELSHSLLSTSTHIADLIHKQNEYAKRAGVN